MGREVWKAGNMVYPVPAVMVSLQDLQGRKNIITVAWTGTVCSSPAMTYISVRKERYSHHMLKESGVFVINLSTEDLTRAVDYCGVRSGRDIDKFKEMRLTAIPATKIAAPMIEESPVNIECRVTQVLELGSHDMFLAEVVAVNVDDQYIDDKGKFHLTQAHPMVYSHGAYYGLGKTLGTFGYSVRKKKAGQ